VRATDPVTSAAIRLRDEAGFNEVKIGISGRRWKK
jgi:hypothetical protein